MKKVNVQAFFKGRPGDEMSALCEKLFTEAGGEMVGCGTELQIGERDYQYDVPANKVEAIKQALLFHGFRLEPSPDNFAWN